MSSDRMELLSDVVAGDKLGSLLFRYRQSSFLAALYNEWAEPRPVRGSSYIDDKEVIFQLKEN